MQQRGSLRLQIPARAEEPAVRELSAAHMDRDVALLAAQPQRIVARRESRDDEEAVLDLHLRGFVRSESPRALPQQRYFARDPVLVRRLPGLLELLDNVRWRGHAHRLLRARVNHRGPRALEVIERPRTATPVRNLRAHARDARQRAERDAPDLIRAQCERLHSRKIAVLNREHDLLIRKRLAISAEQLEGVALVEFREVPVIRRFGLLNAIQRPRMARRDIALLAARAEDINFPREHDA